MKHINPLGGHLTRGTLTVALAGLTLLTFNLAAQEKGAERLMQLPPLSPVADVQKVQAGDTVAMSCPKCNDTWVTSVEKTGKAANPQEKRTVLRHECPGCSTRIVTEGVGKLAQNKVVHTCKHCGNEHASCCATKNSAHSTHGMEAQSHPHAP
jgi:hypothetical protein